MGVLKEIRAVTAMNIASIPQRMGTSLVIVIGMACVAAVFLSALSLSVGFIQALEHTGSPSRAVVLSQGAPFEQASNLERQVAAAVGDAPGVAHNAAGKPILSAESFSGIPATKRDSDLSNFMILRAIGPEGFELRPNLKIIEGRMFKPAVRELIVGKSAHQQFAGLDLGDKITLPEGEWTIVGIFESGGDIHQTSVMGDTDTILAAFRRNTYNSVVVQLTSPEAFSDFKAALTTNPAIAVDVYTEPAYIRTNFNFAGNLLSLIAYWVGGIMATGALFGAINTMYAAVSARSVEIATLPAIGFGAGGVVVSVIAEAVLLAATGAVIGGIVPLIAFDGHDHLAGPIAFKLMVTPTMLFVGLGIAVLVGLLSALFPAIRAARLPIATALQSR